MRVLFLLLLLLLLISMPFWPRGVRKSRLSIGQDQAVFPRVSGFNLNREEVELPRDLPAELTLLFVPFLQRQQPIVDSWVPFVQSVMADAPHFDYLELPTIDERSMLSRTFINEGMRAGIPDDGARARTVTLYIDTHAFRGTLDIPGKDEVHIFLVDRAGAIRWRTTGGFSEEKGAALRAQLHP